MVALGEDLVDIKKLQTVLEENWPNIKIITVAQEDYEHSQIKLTLRSTQNIKSSRASITLTQYEEYFENVKKSLANVEPHNIINFDETNLSDDPGCQKCIFKRGTKYPNKILDNSKTAISIMFAARHQ